ncbi:unnamed protein product [Brachionus calyciflorus]|uniref:Uncharacterized protein n=1 Tax=Brachionus calyciflorus TaxID=104777 RepID=A0A813QCC2_9BILA|nr:unnamed protein product [Brachionus calyciflorus]
MALKQRNRATVNIWLAISARGPTEPICFKNYLNSYGYKIIIDHQIEFVDKTYETRCSLIQDNDSKHSSKKCKTFLKNQERV